MANLQNSQWTALLTKSLQSRLPLDRFDTFATLLSKRNARVPGSVLLRNLLQSSYSQGVDPLVPQYVDYFLRQKWIGESDVLQALLDSFTERIRSATFVEGDDGSHHVSLSGHLEEVLFGILSINLSNAQYPPTSAEAQKLVQVTTTWLHVVARSDGSHHLDIHSRDHEILTAHVALGALIVTLLGNGKFRKAFDTTSEKVKSLRDSIHAFIPRLNQISPQLAHRLEFDAQGLAAPNMDVSMTKIGMGDLNISHIVDGPLVLTHAGLLVYLEAVLYQWPMLDDSSLLSYIHFRSKGDMDVAISELVTASFELCNNALNRGDAPNESGVFRMFLIEKVPLLMLSLSTMAFISVDIALLIAQVLQRPSVGDKARQEFLLACVVHGLIPEDNVEMLLGFKPTQLVPSIGKTSREALIQEYRKDPSQAERFVEHLGLYDGNSAAYAEVIVEILHHLAQTRDTIPLRGLCNALASRDEALDAMALFASPVRFLNPLCQLLDSWTHDEDHSEYQPVYDELGACFLLVTACVARFALKRTDLGPTTSGGFIERMLDGNAALAPSLKELSDEENKHLTGWIRGLFETEGISDELMSACPPQEFIKLVPTIFVQIIIARRLNALESDKLNNGLELLLEPFLLPSAVRGIRFLVQHLWEHSQDCTIILKMLSKLLVPSNSSPPTHAAVVRIVVRDVEQALLDLKTRQPSSIVEIDKLLEQLQPQLRGWRGLSSQLYSSNATSLDNHQHASLATFRQDFKSLCSWSLSDGATAAYSFSCKKLTGLLQASGATRVLQILVDEVKICIHTQLGEIALDIATAIICASERSVRITSAQLSSLRVRLQEGLRLELQDLDKLNRTDPLRVEVLVRLGRRVDTLISSIPHTDLTAPMPALLDSGTDGIIDINNQATELINASHSSMDIQPEEQQPQQPQEPEVLQGQEQQQHQQGQQAQEQQQQADDMAMAFGPDDTDFQLDIDAALAGQNDMNQNFSGMPQSTDDDIFAGLAFDNDMDFS